MRYFIFLHPAGSRRAIVFDQQDNLVKVTSLDTKQMLQLCADPNYKVYLTDRTENLCPFVYSKPFYATYCKLQAKQFNVQMLKNGKFCHFRDEVKKGDCIIYVTRTKQNIWADTVFSVEKKCKFLDAKRNSEGLVEEYHYSKRAVNSHKWVNKKDKVVLISYPNKSFVPQISPQRKLNSLLSKKIQNAKRSIFEIDKKCGEEILRIISPGKKHKISVQESIQRNYFEYISAKPNTSISGLLTYL